MFLARVLFVLCFWGEGEWLGARGGGRNISSPLRRGCQTLFWGGCQILWWYFEISSTPPFRAFYTSFQRKLLKHFGKPYR